MKTYRIAFEELKEIYIKANSVDEAREKFDNFEYDEPENLGITMIDIEEEIK